MPLPGIHRIERKPFTTGRKADRLLRRCICHARRPGRSIPRATSTRASSRRLPRRPLPRCLAADAANIGPHPLGLCVHTSMPITRAGWHSASRTCDQSRPACRALPLACTITQREAFRMISSDGQHIAHGAQCIRCAIGHQIDAASNRAQAIGKFVQPGVAIFVPRYVVDDRTVQAIKQDVAGVLVAGLGRLQPAAHDAEVAFNAELRACGGHRRAGLDCTTPPHTTQSAPACWAAARSNSSFRILLPPSPSPVQSSRFIQSVVRPICAASLGAASIGVGR